MAAFFKRQMSIISRLLLPLLVLSCATALPEPDSTQRPPLDVGLVQQLHGLLHEADQKLLGNNSDRLDVPGAVKLLEEVHQHVARYVVMMQPSGQAVPTAAAKRTQHAWQPLSQHQASKPPDMKGSDVHLLHQPQSGPLSTGAPSHKLPRQARRAAGGRNAKAAAAWQELGRASYMLAALSASGLITEYLPLLHMHAPDGRATLCQQLQSAGKMTSSSRPLAGAGRDQRLGCQLSGSEPRMLQELHWLLTAAAVGTVEAQMALADRFLMGRGGLSVSCPDGLAWLQEAATAVMRQAEAAGNWDLVPSFIRLRERFIDMSSPQSYSEWDEDLMGRELHAAAAFGSADSYAQRRLGYRLLLGRGMSVDYRAAYERFVAAADGGNDGYALYNLGVMYLKGWHVARNSVQALRYFRRALERGVGAAANAIGVLTARGDTFPADYQNAARWFEKGANMSDPDSIYNLGSLYLHGRGVPRDAQAALSYYGMAFDMGHWKAAYALGQLYAGNQPGVGHSCEYAEKYYWQFVSQRSSWLPVAQTALQVYDRTSFAATHAAASHTDDPASHSLHGAPEQASTPAGSTDGGHVAGAAALQVRSHHVPALVRYLLLAESGCEAAAENAAWMLLHGQGAVGPRAVGLAAHLLYRSSLLNHTSSMVELARLLLNEPVITHKQQLQLAVAAASKQLPRVDPAQLAGASSGNLSLGLLHDVLLQQPDAFMPPVSGPTACTGLYRQQIPAIVHNVSAGLAGSQSHRSQQRGAGRTWRQGFSVDAVGQSSGGSATGMVVLRARRAAVSWLFEAGSVGDAEAAALLGWLWHDGVLQGSGAQQEALAVISRAMQVQTQPGQQQALQLAQAAIWLAQQAGKWLGSGAVAKVRSALSAASDAAVRLHATQPVVLDVLDGLATARPAHAAHQGLPWSVLTRLQQWVAYTHQFLGAIARRQHAAADGGRARDVQWGQAASRRFWEYLGADRVDSDNLVLTCLLGALAAVLWLHVRQQGQRAARAAGRGRADEGLAPVAAPAGGSGADQAAPAGGGGADQAASVRRRRQRQAPEVEADPGEALQAVQPGGVRRTDDQQQQQIEPRRRRQQQEHS